MIILTKKSVSKGGNPIFSPSGDDTEEYSKIYVPKDSPLGKKESATYISLEELKNMTDNELSELIGKSVSTA